MRDGLCSRKGRRSMEIEKVYDVKEEGVYMKQLTAKDGGGGGGGSPESEIDNTQKPKQPKKQVRRRLHTSKPYQERLLNMAEARREIVTALKFHRASMKQQEASTTTTAATSATTAANHDRLLLLGQERKPKSRRILSLYPSTTAATTTATSYWPISTTAPPLPSSYHDNLNLLLPSQTLGLNLNFQSFNNLDDTHFYHKPLSSSSSSTPSTSSSAPVAGKSKETVSNSSGSGLHHAMGDEEMEEIRSLGEKHQIEWNDTVNLVTSARWCNFLKTMEIEQEEGDEFYKIDQVMEFPPWLINANESSCLQDDHFSDATLPCMDIGEIEGMDGEWLA